MEYYSAIKRNKQLILCNLSESQKHAEWKKSYPRVHIL